MSGVDLALRVSLRLQHPIGLEVDLHCPPRELLALVGPSGGGKSTVLRAIAGLLRTAQGRIDCGGETWLDSAQGIRRTPQQRRVGLVFQQYALFPHLSALENVAEAVPRDRAGRLELARELLARVNLQGFENRRPHELSGGQQQRVAVARALAREPAVLLLDEPFSAVDELTRRHLHGELAQLRQQLDMPVVLVTHDLDEAALLCDRMAVLADGRILQAGTPAEVLQRPASVRVARLVGMHNLFGATVERHDDEGGHTWLTWHGLSLRVPLAKLFATGSRVAWALPADQVLLPPREGTPEQPGDTRVEVEVVSVAVLRQSLQVRLRTQGSTTEELLMQVPPGTAARYGVAPGVRLRVRLRGGAMVVMPHEGMVER